MNGKYLVLFSAFILLVKGIDLVTSVSIQPPPDHTMNIPILLKIIVHILIIQLILTVFCLFFILKLSSRSSTLS